ncbi:hypothetical protein F383_26819 [Gossypium arboreum]|uniref:Uncharacterized protein n=1 Tax=Gossypium arboreum TaxID=29729 RepID=A0A0B0P8A9_GOSAR|nr:hypothetical protein F383_26819 [Gossypium arboreum]
MALASICDTRKTMSGTWHWHRYVIPCKTISGIWHWH